jgi:hypothetical protein
MEINVLDYLSQDEIKSICEQEIRTKIQTNLNDRDIDLIIGNGAYYKVWNVVDEYVNEEYQQKLVEKIHSIIDEMSDFNVLRYSYNDRAPISQASKLLEQVVNERKEDIVAKMNEVVDRKLNGDDNELYFEFADKITNALWNGFTVKFEK